MAESNDSEKQTAPVIQKAEDDLDSLLDSALDDFTEAPKEIPVTKKVEESTNSGEEEVEQMWSEMIKQALQADPNMREMFGQGSVGESEFVKDFTKIAEAAAKVIEGESSSNFSDIVSETLKNLNENSETIKNQFGNPEELANLFQELGLVGDGVRPEGNIDEIPPFLQNIMQRFLSKDVLYPSIKDFVERYPAWLEVHKDTLSTEQYENYCKQLELMKKVVEEFEAEAESDSEEVKRQRFQRIMGHLQQMQALGQPPAELIQSDTPFDECTMPNLPPGLDPQQCCVM